MPFYYIKRLNMEMMWSGWTGWELNGLSDSETVYPGIGITEEEYTILVCTLYQPMFLWERMWGLRQMEGMQVHRWLTEACLLCTDGIPTAVLKSVSRLDKSLTSNGGLLNMKFLPEFFETEQGVDQFVRFLRTFVDLEIPHIQFNVVRREDLISAKEKPEQYHSLTVRVAGYTAYFTELAEELQDEIIARTSYAGI